ncbi:hypothetical protein [Oerskovia jenensis]|uniref:hypothetical protein n=1 Tax=Oerskovia jenensis TaxID=162169 RepID=UPI0036DD0AC2
MTQTATPAGTEVLATRVFPRFYRDSVALMALASALEKREGIVRVGAVMATPANLTILEASQMLPADLTAAADDLVVVARGIDEETAQAALDAAEEGLVSVETSSGARAERAPQTIAEGIAAAAGAERPATLATVSVPGTYAPVVVEQALDAGLHVFCFSDNVSVADERRLKEKAVAARLLLMGPDCGTAVLDGTPLGFANAVRPGTIGIVAASGTGAQEVSCLVDRAGAGVSQLIGVGGRDLTEEIGGLMTHLALDRLETDEATRVVVVVSKPPAPAVADALLARLERVAAGGTPVVACLLGLDDRGEPGSDSLVVRGTLEGGALAAAELAGHPLVIDDPLLPAARVAAGRVLGLYAGGTLASEAKILLGRAGVDAEVLDLGDDQYTAGRPHPMIDPQARAERIAAAGSDPTVAIVLCDVVLGFGSAADPATPVAEAVRTAREAARADGRELVVVASVCAAVGDRQGLDAQRSILRAAGIVVADSNAAAARAAIALTTTDPSTTEVTA